MIVRLRRTSKRRGGVLIACLTIVMTMAAMSAMLLQLEANRARQQLFGADQKRALNMAEAGLAEAYYGLSVGLTGNVGAPGAPARFGDGLFWVEATEVATNLINLESTGMCGAGRATLALVVRIQPVSIASLGVMGGDSVTVGNRALVDSYDSRVAAAPTEETPESASFRLQSNGDISVGSNAYIDGDATPGPSGSVILSLGAVVAGATAPSNSPVVMPSIDVPELAAKAFSSPLVPTLVTIPSSEGAYGEVYIGPTSKLTIEGPATLSLDELSILDLGHLHFDTTNGPITLYVNDYLNLAPTAKVTFSQRDPKLVSLLIEASATADHNGDLLPDAPVNFNYAGAFYGSVYAPQARLALPNDFQFFGALAAKQLVLGARSKVHFDVALENESLGDASSVQMLSWRVVDVPTSVSRNLSPDPFKSLGVDAATLEKPSESHEDASYQIHIQYLDLLSVQRSYRGPEAAFDWGQVLTVLKLLRQPL
jgi:hypothetical protein